MTSEEYEKKWIIYIIFLQDHNNYHNALIEFSKRDLSYKLSVNGKFLKHILALLEDK